jgi:hypothetical protein
MTRVRLVAIAIVAAVAVGTLVALVIVLVGSSRGTISLFDVNLLINAIEVAVMVSLPVSLVGGILGAALVLRSWPNLANRNLRDRAQWGWKHGAVVGVLVTTGYFVLLGGFHWAIPLLAVLGGLSGAAAGAVVAACILGHGRNQSGQASTAG